MLSGSAHHPDHSRRNTNKLMSSRDFLNRLPSQFLVRLAGVGLLLGGTTLVMLGLLWPEEQESAAASPQNLTQTAELVTREQTPSGPALVDLPSGPDRRQPPPGWWLKQQRVKLSTAEEDADGPAPPATPGETAIAVADEESAPAQVAAAESAAGVPTTRAAGTDGSTPIQGLWGGSADDLATYLTSNNAAPRFTVPAKELAELYVRYANEVGVRADVLWAQMLHETGFGKYGGDVRPEQNNYAGIGAVGGGAAGHAFATPADGVRGHVAHMAAYVYSENKADWTNSATDPRYDLVNPRGQVRVLSDLDGRWAVPGNGYGAAIERHVIALNP